MGWFKSKPVIIKAFRYLGGYSVDEMRVDWGKTFADVARHSELNGLTIETLEGTMRAELGDWIIKGTRGEFYPCKPDVFDVKYEPLPPWKGDEWRGGQGAD